LAPLNYYGGRTRTHALYSDSDAIDAGDNDFIATYDLIFDQRGNDRTKNGDNLGGEDIDIGAFELVYGEI
jgi:hypothetical protein